MTKVLIYKACNTRFKSYAVVAPNGVKPFSGSKWAALSCAKGIAKKQIRFSGEETELQFRQRVKVIGSFMVKHAK